MTDASFIAAGWIGTAAAVAAYATSILLRTRRLNRVGGVGTATRSSEVGVR